MRTFLQAMGLLALFALGATTTDGRPQRIDEWDALDRSLKTAKSMHPADGFVPDQATAIKIGEAVATAQYGGKRISQETPFRARLRGDVWTVQGTLHPQGVYGGTAVIQLSKKDGRILLLIHQE